MGGPISGMKFIKYAFIDNKWLWFHILSGGVLALFIPIWAVLSLAILWEFIEYITTDVDRIYGSFKRFFLDAFGDVFGALAMAVIVKLATGV